MVQLFRNFIFCIKSIVYIPHVIFYLLSKNSTLIDEDCRVNVIHRHRNYIGVPSLLLMLQDDCFIRLFYYRLGDISKLISWYIPGDKMYKIECQSLGVYCRHSFATILSAQYICKNFSCRHSATLGNNGDTNHY